jgi:hypothetical protein
MKLVILELAINVVLYTNAYAILITAPFANLRGNTETWD